MISLLDMDEGLISEGPVRTGAPLVVRLPNWIGDTVMALPTLTKLAEGGPMVLVGRPWAVDLLAGHGWPVRALPADRAGMIRVMAEAAGGDAGRCGLLLTHSLSSAWVAWRAGLRCTGFLKDWRGIFLKQGLPWVPGQHEARRYWALGKAVQARRGGDALSLPLSLSWPVDPPAAVLRLSAVHMETARAALCQSGVNGPYRVICPLATGLVAGRPKQWPGFPALAAGLVKGPRLVTCAPADRHGELAAAVPGAVILPPLSTGAFAALLAGAERVIANDSGPMHVAAAAGARTIGIFGVSDPARTGAWGGSIIALGGPTGWPDPDQVIAAVNAPHGTVHAPHGADSAPTGYIPTG